MNVPPTGYTERKLVKNMESVRVEYDGTVRNAQGRILQFSYGDDGGDGLYTERVKYNVPSTDEWEWTSEELTVVEVATRQRCVAETARLRDGITLIAEFLPTLTLLLDPTTVWDRVPASMCDFRSPYTLDEALDRSEKLLNDVRDMIPPNPLFEAVIGLSFASKRLVGKHPMYIESVCENLLARLQKGMVNPGEMVGVVAAQSISEPATQQVKIRFRNSKTND